MENNKKKSEQQKIQLSLTLGSINDILSALGNLPYKQVYDLIQNIRVQTELKLNERSVLKEEEKG